MGLKACHFRGRLKNGRYQCDCAAVIQPEVEPAGCAACPVPELLAKRAVLQRRSRASGVVAAITPATSAEDLAARRAAYNTPEAVAARTKAAEELRIRNLGPGTQLKNLLAELGLQPSSNCQCDSRAAQMNAWGVIGCLDNRETIMGWLREEAEKASWGSLLYGAVKLALGKSHISLFDPYNSLLAEAIRRAESAAAPQRPEDRGQQQEGHAEGQ